MSKTTKKSVLKFIDIAAIEDKLPQKRPRSHHVLVKAEKLVKSFDIGGKPQRILKDIDLSLYSGEFVVVYGPSGCGKSTFLHTVLGLEKPTRGKVFLRGQDIYKMDNDERTNFRRQKIGMVFQQANWIKSLSVWENVAYPLLISGFGDVEAKARAFEVLKDVGIMEMANKKPAELSGGQQQRVALARALSTDPWIIMADEPTGNLDTASSAEIITLLAKLNRVQHRTIIMVTHDMNFLQLATRRIAMTDGRVVADDHD